MRRGGKGRGFTSIKEGASSRHAKKGLKATENLGRLMARFRGVEDVLYSYTSNMDMVFEDMDFSIEEFSDMTGADLDELLDALNKVCRH